MPAISHSKTRRTGSRLGNSHKNSKRRCMRPGPIGRNPYLNFLRDFRKKCCGLSAVETIRMGAKQWNRLSKEEKLRYIEEAFYAPKRTRRMSKTRKHVMSRPAKRVRSKKSSRSSSTSRKSVSSNNRRNFCGF